MRSFTTPAFGVLLVRVVAWRFLSTRDPKAIATFKADFEAAKQRFDRIEKLYPAAKLRPLVRAARTSLADAGAGREPSVRGDTPAQFKTAQRSDEIGEVAAAVANFRDNVIAQQEAANNSRARSSSAKRSTATWRARSKHSAPHRRRC